MTTVSSSITKNTGRYAMIHTAFFYISVNFAFNLPHYATSYMHHTGEKKGGKKIRKEKKNKVTKNSLQGVWNLDPQKQ